MNPEEGELRPQLIDRFGLMVELQNCFDPRVRQQIVKARLAFDADPHAFRATYAARQAAYMQRIHAARERLPNLTFSESLHEHVSRVCIEAAVDGLRADLVMLRAARALAALEQETTVATGHVDRVAEAVLAHRRHERETHAAQPPDRQPAPQRQSDSTQSHASQEESDWGHLPPEPTGTANVKGVIPLPAKKR